MRTVLPKVTLLFGAQAISEMVFKNPHEESILRIAVCRLSLGKLRERVMSDAVLKQACAPTSARDVTASIKSIAEAAVEAGAPTEAFQDRSCIIDP